MPKNYPILNINDSFIINAEDKNEKKGRNRDIEEGIRLTPGLDPNHLSTSPIAEPVFFETISGSGVEIAPLTSSLRSRSLRFNSTGQGASNFHASEDDQIIRRGLDQLQFTLPLNSPLLKSAQDEISINSYSGGSGVQFPVSRLKTPINSASLSAATQQPIHSPYIRMCTQLENFVDAESEVADTFLFNREQEFRQGSVDLSPELLKAKLLFTNSTNNQDNNYNNTSTNNAESRSLWLGNVDPTVTEDEIRVLFEPFGPIENIRLLPSKECAFVNYYETQTAIRAKNELNGTQLGNMLLRIGFGKINDTKAGGNGNNEVTSNNPSSSASTTMGSLDSRSIWIGNVGPDVSTDLLLFHFAQFGPIESCRILETKNCAFVNFYSPEAAVMARIKMNGAQIGSSMIKTGFAKDSNSNNNNNNNNGNNTSNSNTTEKESNNLTFASITSKLIPSATAGASASQKKDLLDIDNLREMRRKVEASSEEIPKILDELYEELDKVAIDSYGNILLQKIIERATESDQLRMVQRLSQVVPQIAMNKNGTWVIQKFITAASSEGVQIEAIKYFLDHVCEMLEDQFGNYVIQCALNTNVDAVWSESDGYVIVTQIQSIVDSIIKNIRKLACGRFSSRALKSILDASSSNRQKKISQAIAKEAVFLSVDPNGVVVIQWILDSDLSGKISLITTQLQGRLAQVALTKPGSGIIAKIVGSQEETSIRDEAISELYELAEGDFNSFKAKKNAHLEELLSEPSTCSILLKAFQMSKPAIRIKLSAKLTPKLQEIISNNSNTKSNNTSIENTQNGGSQQSIPLHLSKLYNEILNK